MKKQERINKILDDAAKALADEGVKYFMGVVDKQPKDPDGGKAYVSSDVKGEDMCYILSMAFPSRQDVINLGIWVGQLITSRKQDAK